MQAKKEWSGNDSPKWVNTQMYHCGKNLSLLMQLGQFLNVLIIIKVCDRLKESTPLFRHVGADQGGNGGFFGF